MSTALGGVTATTTIAQGPKLLRALEAARRSQSEYDVARAEEAVIRHYLPVAASIARRFRSRTIESEDVQQVAMLGLVKSVRGWRHDRGDGFLQYAVPMISGEIKRFFRDHASTIRLPRHVQEVAVALAMARRDLSGLDHEPTARELAAAAGVTVSDVEEDRKASDRRHIASLDQTIDGQQIALCLPADEELAPCEDRVMLAHALAKLSDRERRLVALRYFNDQTQDEMAKLMGVSQMQISRLLRRILGRLREDFVAA